MQKASSLLGGGHVCNPYHRAFYLFAAAVLHLALIAVDLVFDVAADDEIGRVYRLLLAGSASVLLARCCEGKVVLLILVILVDGSSRLEILQCGCALDLRSRGCRYRDRQCQERN